MKPQNILIGKGSIVKVYSVLCMVIVLDHHKKYFGFLLYLYASELQKLLYILVCLAVAGYFISFLLPFTEPYIPQDK